MLQVQLTQLVPIELMVLQIASLNVQRATLLVHGCGVDALQSGSVVPFLVIMKVKSSLCVFSLDLHRTHTSTWCTVCSRLVGA
jgi:hypothetical protein